MLFVLNFVWHVFVDEVVVSVCEVVVSVCEVVVSVCEVVVSVCCLLRGVCFKFVFSFPVTKAGPAE